MSAHTLLEVQDLAVHAGAVALLHPVSFALDPGECLVIMGESGAGKSLLAQAIMGQLPSPLTAHGGLKMNSQTYKAHQPGDWQKLWGRALTLLPQEPSLALSPLRSTHQQLAEVYQLVAGAPAMAAQVRAQQTLTAAGLQHAANAYPWQLSGGMAQRAVTAMALAGGAQVLLADEPTKGLDDVWRQAFISTLLGTLQEGACAVVITHDLDLAQRLGGRMLVMQHGRVVEQGRTADVLVCPQHPFTQALIAACPSRWPALPSARVAVSGEPLLTLTQVSKRWAKGPWLFEKLDLEVHACERLSLTGPSGCGKSTLGQVMLGLIQADSGKVTRHAALHAHAFQKLYQDPVKAFPPRQTLKSHLEEVMKQYKASWQMVKPWMARLNLNEQILERPASQVSGGELQRLALLRTLLARPAFVFADEPTSRLDPLTQRSTMTLLCGVLDELESALLLVTHDATLAQAVSDRCVRLG